MVTCNSSCQKFESQNRLQLRRGMYRICEESKIRCFFHLQKNLRKYLLRPKNLGPKILTKICNFRRFFFFSFFLLFEFSIKFKRAHTFWPDSTLVYCQDILHNQNVIHANFLLFLNIRIRPFFYSSRL